MLNVANMSNEFSTSNIRCKTCISNLLPRWKKHETWLILLMFVPCDFEWGRWADSRLCSPGNLSWGEGAWSVVVSGWKMARVEALWKRRHSPLVSYILCFFALKRSVSHDDSIFSFGYGWNWWFPQIWRIDEMKFFQYSPFSVTLNRVVTCIGSNLFNGIPTWKSQDANRCELESQQEGSTCLLHPNIDDMERTSGTHCKETMITFAAIIVTLRAASKNTFPQDSFMALMSEILRQCKW